MINRSDPIYKNKKCKFCTKVFTPTKFGQVVCSVQCEYARNRQLKEKRKQVTELTSVEKEIKKQRIKHYQKYNQDKYKFVKNSREMRNKQKSDVGYTFCERCKRAYMHLEAHHIIYRSEQPRHVNLHNKRNLTLCCMECHAYYHSSTKNREQLIKERKLRELFPDYVRKDFYK